MGRPGSGQGQARGRRRVGQREARGRRRVGQREARGRSVVSFNKKDNLTIAFPRLTCSYNKVS